MGQQDDDSAISVAMDHDPPLKKGETAGEGTRAVNKSTSRGTPPSGSRSATPKGNPSPTNTSRGRHSLTEIGSPTTLGPLDSSSSSIGTSLFTSSTLSLSKASTGSTNSGVAETPLTQPASHSGYQPPSGWEYLGGDGNNNNNYDNADADREDHEAAQQVEEAGSIVVDHDDLATDAGYASGSDSHTAASTSLASSVRDYAFEHGRRYHKFREGRYNFPNDDVEQEREDMKHAMVKLLCQQLHFAPIGENPQQVLDIGTGTGIWAIESALCHPARPLLPAPTEEDVYTNCQTFV